MDPADEATALPATPPSAGAAEPLPLPPKEPTPALACTPQPENSSAAAADETQEDADVCPFCLDPPVAPCRTSCAHLFCTACLVRAFRSKPAWNRGQCPLCRKPASVYTARDVATGAPLALPDVDTIFGSVYLQGGQSGVASYHFDGPEDCYISYSAAPAAWRLDDGSPPPQRKAFEDAAYEPATRTFTGTVRWSTATFGGDARWEYTMIFSDDFRVISGGALQAYGRGGSAPTRRHRFPHKLRYWRQRDAPQGLAGCAFMQGSRMGLASYHFPAVDAAYISYEAAPPEWRLDNGTPPPQQKPFLDPAFDPATRTFTGSIDWSTATFGGDARWEYTMVFSEGFSAIAGGSVKCYREGSAEGEGPSSEDEFGVDLMYELYVEEEAQMHHLLNGLSDEDEDN